MANVAQFVPINAESLVSPAAVESLRSIDSEIESFRSTVDAGEPRPPSLGLRGRLGFALKRRLYRLLWWHSHQIRTLSDLLARHSREELAALQAISHGTAGQRLRYVDQSISDVKRHAQDLETRLRQLESAQLMLQAAEVERKVREGTAAPKVSETELRQELSDIREHLQRVQDQATAQASQNHATLIREIARIAQQLDGQSVQQSEISERLTQIDRLEQVQTRLATRVSDLGLFTHQTRATLSVQDRRLSLFIEEARKRLPETFSQDQLSAFVNGHKEHRYDSLYAAFEDVFRGTRDEIKARQSVYLPLLKEHGIGTQSMAVLDLGCGRGEWLEVLREESLESRGVDNNEEMVNRCKSLGLSVIKDDALSYVHALPEASVGAVTSFHMIEHMTFDAIMALVDGCLRVLKPGGLIILETPNPANILVGAHTFHLDPTHLKPVPSPMLRFFVEARGFCDVHVLELHPYPETLRFPDDEKGMASRLNDYLYGPQDYAVIGRKA